MNKEELIGKLQMVYVGDINALNELIGYYDGLKQGIEELQQERNQFKEYTNHNYDKAKKYKEVIKKAIEYLETATIDPQSMRHYRNCLLEILKGSDKNEQ